MRNSLILVIFCLSFSHRTVNAQNHLGYWEGFVQHLDKTWKIGVDFESNSQGELAWVDFIEIGGYHRKFDVKRNGKAIYFERKQPDGRPPLIFDGTFSSETISGSWSGIGIQEATFSLHRASKLEFEEEEVLFKNEDNELSGTLLLPARSGPHPVVIFMHGGAPEERTVYYSIASKFLRQGIAALIYDKRGVGKSRGGDWRTAGITGLAKDAIAAVDLLKQRRDINPRQIGVFGHSEGGWTAPMASVLSKDVAFVIASGASAVNATEQSVYHRTEVMRSKGFSEEAILRAKELREQMNAASKLCLTNPTLAKTEGERVAKELETIRNEPWFEASALPYRLDPECPSQQVLELLFKDPLSIWSQVHVPVYLAWGSEDKVVPVHLHGTIVRALKENGNNRVTVSITPGVDHSWYFVKKANDWDFPRESQSYSEDMVKWVKTAVLKSTN